MTKDGHQQPMPKTLAELREAAGLSQTDVAERMGYSGRARITHIEARYPNLNYDTVTRYMQAIGVKIEFVVKGRHVPADTLIPDPEKEATREYLGSRPGKGSLVYQPSPKELPLEQRTADSGGDDTGRDVDQPDAEGHQGDREDREEP